MPIYMCDVLDGLDKWCSSAGMRSNVPNEPNLEMFSVTLADIYIQGVPK